MNFTAILLTFRLALLSTLILLILGLPLAYWLATTKWKLRFLVEAIVSLPIVLPPTVVGFYLLVALGPKSPLGKIVQSLTGSTIPFTFTGILIGAVVFNLPFAVRPFTSAFAGVDRKLVEASWCLGVSKRQTFLKIVLPVGMARHSYRFGVGFCTYDRRIRRSADARRKYSRRNTDDLHCYLR